MSKSKYKASDDGKKIDGKIVVFASAPGTGPRTGTDAVARIAAVSARNADGAAQAAALTAAAAAAVPFCEECDKSRQEHRQQQPG